MGLILDLAVVAVAVAVIGSLALLTWTLAMAGVRSARDARRRVARARRLTIEADARFRAEGGGTAARVADLARRTAAMARRDQSDPRAPAGERPNA